MERYMIITAKQNAMCVLVEVNSDTLQIVNKAVIRDTDIPNAVRGCRPINFSIENGVLKESMGSFERLKVKDGIRPCIVLQELTTSVGTIMGYRLFNPANYSIVALKKEDIIARQSKSSIPILQNGIIRGNKVSCYPNSPFPKFIIGTKTRTSAKKVKLSGGSKEETQHNSNLLNQSMFTPEQRRELSLAKKDGVSLKLIANPDLSPEQMRVLWVSKKKGAYSEYFASPRYSVEVMKFYADRLVTQQMVKECGDLLSRPDYDVNRLSELYLAVCEGVDYSSFIDMKSADEMRVQREKLRSKLWDTKIEEDEYINSAVKFAEKLKKKG